MKITFTKTIEVPEKFSPKPASTYLPEWYKQMESYTSGSKRPDGAGGTTATIKRCMPVFDAITSGYIIPTDVDVWVTQRRNENGELESTWYEWPSADPISWHPIEQAPNHPNRNGHVNSYPKWINPWAIKTPPGYSCLFVQPFHRESVFTILPGVVDTDTYTAPVNFPFVLNSMEFEGLIPAGTPMAQVIPFKRDEFEMEFGSEIDFKEQASTTRTLRSRFFDSYKDQFRSKKSYK